MNGIFPTCHLNSFFFYFKIETEKKNIGYKNNARFSLHDIFFIMTKLISFFFIINYQLLWKADLTVNELTNQNIYEEKWCS
jgi:hypothetical protein